uniref:Uncharacterized protein n=1 Tax=Anopheles merus TaxID=30066 RepID=A0A182ULY8_ANOME
MALIPSVPNVARALACASRTLSVATSLVSWARSPEFRSTSFSSLSSRFWFSFWTRLCDSYSRSYLSCQAMMLSSSSTCRSLSCRQALSIASSCVCLSASALFSTSISAASCTSQFCRKWKKKLNEYMSENLFIQQSHNDVIITR